MGTFWQAARFPPNGGCALDLSTRPPTQETFTSISSLLLSLTLLRAVNSIWAQDKVVDHFDNSNTRACAGLRL